MKANYTHIVVLLDRSGSMMPIAADTRGGFNKFLEDQKKAPGEATITLVQFDDQYETNYTGVDIKAAKPLDEQSYVPRGNTALVYSYGRTIDEVGRWLAAKPESERPSRVIFLTMTDGQENWSQHIEHHPYTNEKVKEMTKVQTETYKWEFIYLGANVNAFDEARNLGIAVSNAANYVHSGKGMAAAYCLCSAKIANAREELTRGRIVSMAFNDAERSALDNEDAEQAAKVVSSTSASSSK